MARRFHGEPTTRLIVSVPVGDVERIQAAIKGTGHPARGNVSEFVRMAIVEKLEWEKGQVPPPAPVSTSPSDAGEWPVVMCQFLEGMGYGDRVEMPTEVCYLDRSGSEVIPGKYLLLSILCVFKDRRTFTENGRTFSPAYVRYVYEPHIEKPFVRMVRSESYDFGSNLLSVFNPPEDEKPLVYYEPTSPIAIYAAMLAGAREHLH